MDERTDQRLAALEGAVAELHQRLVALESTGVGAASAQPYGVYEPPLDPGGPSGPTTQAGWAQEPWPEILDLVRSGRKIQAIKRHREYFRTGLAESKGAVDRIG